MAERSNISRRLRFEVLKRDGHTCRYCGASAPDVTLTVDHVVPVSLGGSDDPSNLVAACVDCNSGKGSSNPDDEFVRQVEEDAFEWKRTVKDALRREVKEYPAVVAALEQFDQAWLAWHHGDDETATVARDSGWRKSVKTWLNVIAHGELEDAEFVALAAEVVIELIPSAMKPGIDNRWRYFCGCVWNRIRTLQAAPPPAPEPIEHYEETVVDLGPHAVVEDDGVVWCETCWDRDCSVVRQYRINRGYGV